ncbi:MAG: hypothetical protein M3N93_14725 [Acidobacteriota bacterium]|nr:hypothetical protein [Acidobacteriota bacterium]
MNQKVVHDASPACGISLLRPTTGVRALAGDELEVLQQQAYGFRNFNNYSE